MSSYGSNHSTAFTQRPYQHQHQHQSHPQPQPQHQHQPPYPTTPNAYRPAPLPMPSAPRDSHPSTITTTHPISIPTRQPLAQDIPPTSTQPLPNTAPQTGYPHNYSPYTTHHTSHTTGDYAYPDANEKSPDDGVGVKHRSSADKLRHARRERERERSAQRRPTMGDSVVSLASKVKHGLGF